MGVFDPSQIIVLTLFLGILLAALWGVRKFQPQLRDKMAQGHSIRVLDRVGLHPQTTTYHIVVKNQEFLIVTAPKSAPAIQPLGPENGGQE